MQNKGAIKTFAILFAIICLYQLSFTFVTSRVESKARAFATSERVHQEAKTLANGDAVRERYVFDSLAKEYEEDYLDSVGNNVVYNILVQKYTYKQCKEHEINLGLDLRGGMNVVMEVSTSDVVYALAGYSSDSLFNKVMEQAIATNKTTPNSNFVTIFGETWNKIDPNAQMAAIFSYEMASVNTNSTNSEVVEAIRKETTSAYDRTYQVLRQRIDKFGVAQPNIQKLQQTERILIELPGIKDPQRVRKLLQGAAQLEFWATYEFSDVAQNLSDANDYLASYLKMKGDDSTLVNLTDTTAKADNTEDKLAQQLAAGVDSTKTDDGQLTQEQWREKNPLFAVLMPYLGEGDQGRKGPVVGYAMAKDMAKVDRYMEVAKTKFPRQIRFVWSAKPLPGSDIYQLIALKVTTRDNRAPLDGGAITDARQDFGQHGDVEVSMTMNAEGAKVWKNMTAANIGHSIAVVLDNYAYSWPTVNTEISGGQSQISGNFTIEEGQDLANILKAGKLPAPARIVQEAVVGPSLGQQAISAGFMSFVLAFIMVLLYMTFFYSTAGLVANVALLANVFFLFGVLASLGAVLTLPGIAGIVLTMGMAVDANVIIYERVKEELRAGKGVRLAIADGYKHAYSAIIDGNATTLITGIVLYIFGSGPIQGFATTLCIGILTSLFCAIFISRMIFIWLLEKDKNIMFDTKITRNFLANTHIDFIGARKYSYVIAIVLSIISITSLATRGLSLGIDFSGGRTYTVRFDQDVKTDDVRAALTAAFGGEAPEVKTMGSSDQVKISTKYRVGDVGQNVEAEMDHALYEHCKGFYKEEISEDEFTKSDNSKLLGLLSSELVGPTIATDITRSAFLAVAIALLFIFLYIAVRFKHWQYGWGGLVSLAHDALITLGAFSLFYGVLPFSLDIDQAFIAAILTIIGYSINDTVIIFDRLREYIGLYPKRELKQTMNDAINSTLSRTVNTTGTVLVVLIMIFLFGGDVIRGFTFALLFGVLIGVYSSVFIASPIAYDITMRKNKKAAKENK